MLGRVLQLLGIWLVNGWLANKGGRSSASRVYVHKKFLNIKKKHHVYDVTPILSRLATYAPRTRAHFTLQH